jgi:hypothetical protein
MSGRLKLHSLSDLNGRGELVATFKSDDAEIAQIMTRDQLRYFVSRGEHILLKDSEADDAKAKKQLA